MARDRGFHRAFAYLNSRLQPGDGVRVSFVLHSAGAIVANYLLERIVSEFANLKHRVETR